MDDDSRAGVKAWHAALDEVLAAQRRVLRCVTASRPIPGHIVEELAAAHRRADRLFEQMLDALP